MAFYNAMAVANFIIDKCARENNPISNLKLQKVLYFVWVDYYLETRQSLFVDSMAAWQLGPVVPEVYYEYCSYGGRPINLYCELEIYDKDRPILDKIVSKYDEIAVSTLVERTHASGSAWDEVYRRGEGNRKIIPFELIIQKEIKGENVTTRNEATAKNIDRSHF